MKVLIASLCIVCASAFAQDPLAQARADMRVLTLNTRLRQVKEIRNAISQHQSFQLPSRLSLGSKASITATGILGDYDQLSGSAIGDVLRLAGVEIRTDSLIVQADELHLHWDNGEIEPVGNVRVKPIP